MNKRIGILTYAYNNYGGCLQAYALQSYLKKFPQLEVRIIRLELPERRKKERIFQTGEPNLLVNAVTLALTLLRYASLRRRKRRIELFKEHYLSQTTPYRSYEEVEAYAAQTDVLVSGSDQVFNPVYASKRIFYLDFPKGSFRKVAYAPSFGISEFTPQIETLIAPWVRDFDSLSCREREGAEFLKKITGREIPVLADPTLLLDRKEWERISVSPRMRKKYIFVYDLNGGRELIEMAREIKRRTGFQIVCQTQKVRKFYPVDLQIYDSGPTEFLGWIHDAEYVVTDSFHGTLFSILFTRRFYTYIAYPQTASRVKNLLRTMELEERIVEHGQIAAFRYSDTPVEIQLEKLAPLIARSKEFIADHIVDPA